VEDHFETLEQVYEDRFVEKYGFFRSYIRQVIYRYLDCGILHNGFARVRCGECGHEFLLAFSCKRRHFCPSCHQKRVVEFGEWLCEEVIKAVPHRHLIFSLPKMLRRYFLYDRKLLADLSRCAWETLKVFIKEVDPVEGAIPGAVIAIQSFGDFLGYNPHAHILLTDGCFHDNGMFRVAPRFDPQALEEIFKHKVFRLLISKGKITEDMVKLLKSWRHSGFHVFCGNRIQPGDKDAMESLARYIIRACFSQERMTYLPAESKVIYVSKNGKEKKEFEALEWLAAMCSHIPDKGMQMVHYYGFYSNVARGKRKKADQDGLISNIMEDKGSNKEYRKNWARLIQKIYEVDPLICPKCQGKMKVIAFIEDEEVIRKILKHLGLWDRKTRPPPKACPELVEWIKSPPFTKNISYEPSDTGHPPFYPDPDYPVEMYIPQ
jgi:hypothetical protein